MEVWNEPNLASVLDRHAVRTISALYRDQLALAIKQVDPRLQVGGPATAADAWIDEFRRLLRARPRCRRTSSARITYPTDARGCPATTPCTQLSQAFQGILRERAAQVSRLRPATGRCTTPSGARPPTRAIELHDEPYAAAFITQALLSMVTRLVDALQVCGEVRATRRGSEHPHRMPVERGRDGRENGVKQTRHFVGYAARGVTEGPDDGTLVPWGSLACVAHAPDTALAGVRAMLDTYPRALRNGQFVGAINPSLVGEGPEGWVAPGCFGIDQGLLVMMIENARSGMIWSLMRRSAVVRRGLTNLGFRGGWLDAGEAE